MSEQDSPPHVPEGKQTHVEPDPLVDRVLVGKFRLEKLLGVGAMGRVYQAEHLSLAQRIAVKVLHQHLAGDESLARRFHREAKSAFTLNHPNSITIMDFGQDEDGLLYIAMELLDGSSLHDVIDDDGPLSLERSVRILTQVCLALDEAHHQSIVHRDLKPENVMVQDRRGEPDFVKVCDFGIAKVQDASGESAITMAGMVCGTPEYMSPEQARGESLDGRSDLYSLGVILYQMTTCRLPFTAETALGCVTQHLTDEPPRPRDVRPDLDIPPILEEFILRCLAKDREGRPASATAFREELAAIADKVRHGETALPGAAELAFAPETTAVVPRARSARGSRWALVLAVLLVVGGVVAFLVTRGTGHSETESPSARAGVDPGDAAAPRSSAPDAHVAPVTGPDAAGTAADARVVAAGPEASVPRPMDPGRRRRRPPRVRDRPREPPMDRPRPAGDSFDSAYKAARAAWSQGGYSTALAQFRLALKHRPGHAASVKYIAQCYLRLGKPCAALRWFKRYQRRRPGDFFVKQHVKTLSAKCGG